MLDVEKASNFFDWERVEDWVSNNMEQSINLDYCKRVLQAQREVQ